MSELDNSGLFRSYASLSPPEERRSNKAHEPPKGLLNNRFSKFCQVLEKKWRHNKFLVIAALALRQTPGEQDEPEMMREVTARTELVEAHAQTNCHVGQNSVMHPKPMR